MTVFHVHIFTHNVCSMLNEDIVRKQSASDPKPFVFPGERLGQLVQPLVREGILSTDVDCTCSGERERELERERGRGTCAHT